MGREPSPRPEYKAAGFTDDHHTTLLGAAYGMRHFRLDQDGYLVGLTYRTRWVNGVNQAECYNPRRGAVKAAGEYKPATPGPEDRSHSMLECGCGWWAYFGVGEEWNIYGSGDTMSMCGVVRMWGRSVIGTLGSRSLFAQIVALVEPHASQLRYPLFYNAFRRLPQHYSNITWHATRADMLKAWPLSSHYRNPGAKG